MPTTIGTRRIYFRAIKQPDFIAEDFDISALTLSSCLRRNITGFSHQRSVGTVEFNCARRTWIGIRGDGAAAGDVIAYHHNLTRCTGSNGRINITGIDHISARAQGETAVIVYHNTAGFIHTGVVDSVGKNILTHAGAQ